MSKLPLDLSKFRKVKSDKDTSTLQHYEGHQLIIAHNKLSSKLKGQLDKIPLAKQKPKKMAEGGYDSIPVNTDPTQLTVPESFANPNAGQSSSPIETMTPLQQAYNNQQSLPYGVKPEDVAKDTSRIPGSVDDDSGSEDSGPATTKPTVDQDPYGMMGSLNQQLKGVQETGAGQQAEAKAIGDQGAANVAQEQNYQNQAQKNMEAYQQANAPLIQARQALISDIQNGHIDPKRYLENMSTGSKIASGIGLILGGMGSGLTHGPNLAFQYLQNQIDRDIQSQRDDLGKKQNLLSHNLQQTQDLREAYNLTKIQSNDVLASHLRMTADQTADPVAKARMMQIAGMTDQQTAQLQHQAALYKAQQGAFGGQGNGMGLELLPPEMRERAVQLPGGGMRLAIDKDGAKQVREQVQSIQPIFDSLNQLQQLGPSALIPGSPAAQKAEAIRAQLIPLVNENAGLKRLSGEDIGNIKQMFTDPTKFSSLVGSAKTNSFKQFLQNKLLSTMGSQLEGGAGKASAPAAGSFGFKPRK